MEERGCHETYRVAHHGKAIELPSVSHKREKFREPWIVLRVLRYESAPSKSQLNRPSMDELARIRRFALVAAVLLLLYSGVGVEVIAGANLVPLGVPMRVSNPSIIVWGLVILSTVGFVRFLYYGLMLGRSPYRIRREILHALHAEEGKGTYRGSVFFGSGRFSTTPLAHDRAEVEQEVSRVLDAFPGFGTRRPQAKIKPVQLVSDDGEPYTVWEAEIELPRVSRLAAALQDVDYTAPVWTNLLALGVTCIRVLW